MYIELYIHFKKNVYISSVKLRLNIALAFLFHEKIMLSRGPHNVIRVGLCTENAVSATFQHPPAGLRLR